MPSYIAESYLSGTRRGEVRSLARWARDAALTLAEEGHDVAYLRSAFVPEDEVCLHWFIAASPAVITEIGRLAGLEWDRVIEELERPPQEAPCAPAATHTPNSSGRRSERRRLERSAKEPT